MIITRIITTSTSTDPEGTRERCVDSRVGGETGAGVA
jgi:hypothetical protein